MSFGVSAMSLNPGASAKELTWNFGLSSDYLWRGITFSKHKPIFRGGMDYKGKNLTLGTSVSTSQGYGSRPKVVASDESSAVDAEGNPVIENGVENVLYGQYVFPLGGKWSAQVGTLFFYYPFNWDHSYGRAYVGLSWDKVTLQVGQVNYGRSLLNSENASLEYVLTFPIWRFNVMVIGEEDHFLTGGYQYYQVQTKIPFPESWELPDDFNLGVSVGYAIYDDDEKQGYEDYYNYMLSLNRSVKGFKGSVFVSRTNRKTFNPDGNGEDAGDNTVGFSVGKTF